MCMQFEFYTGSLADLPTSAAQWLTRYALGREFAGGSDPSRFFESLAPRGGEGADSRPSAPVCAAQLDSAHFARIRPELSNSLAARRPAVYKRANGSLTFGPHASA